MTKTSREVAKMATALSGLFSQAEGVGPLKLVEFVQKDGDRVAFNPNHVARVEQRSPTTTRIITKDGSGSNVEGDFQDVIDALQE